MEKKRHEENTMRKVHVTFECDERVLGPLIVDLSEKPNTRIVHIKAVSELPHHMNGKANGKSGLTGFEVAQKLVKSRPEFTATQLKNEFLASGLSPASVNSFLASAQKRGVIERRAIKGQRTGVYRIVKQ